MYSISDALIKTYTPVYISSKPIYRPATIETIISPISPIYDLDNNRVYVSSLNSYMSDPIKEQNEVHSGFLRNDRPKTAFIGCDDDILSYVKETFAATCNKELPPNISIRVMARQRFKEAKMFYGGWSEGILGFAINSTQEIFVMENDLDILLITLGHEIGHVLTESLDDSHDEEAKAFAFEMAWVKSIQRENIAGLAGSIDPDSLRPAKNGLHNIAFDFVNKIMLRGFEAIEIYDMIVKKLFRVNFI